MNDFVVMQILDAQSDLTHKVASFRFRYRLAPFVQLHQRPPPAELQQNIHVFAVLEEGEKLNDVLVFEGLVDGDLLRHLLFGMLFDEQRLGHDLPGENRVRLEIREFVAAGEPAFAHEFPLLVALPGLGIDDQVGHLAQGLPTRRRHGGGGGRKCDGGGERSLDDGF